MSLLKVVPDREWLLVEENLRFPVDCTVPPALVPVVIAGDLQKSIDTLERLREWKRLELVPTRKAFAGKPCCLQMAKKPGSVLKIIIKPSPFQGDVDDATNALYRGDSVAVENEGNRIENDGLIDWVAVLHFWQPAIHYNREEFKEELTAPIPGFADWDSILGNWPVLKQRYPDVFND